MQNNKNHFTILNGKIRFDGDCSQTRPFCGAVCCKNTVVLLTKEEQSSGKYEFQEPTENCNCQACNVMRQTGLKALPRTDVGCTYLDGQGQCSIYEDRPARCRGFVCEKNWWNLQLVSNPPRQKDGN